MENLRLLLLPLCLIILLPWKMPETELTFMDVGQGDGIYLGCGEDILLDSGSSSTKHIGEYTIEPFLRAKAAGRLDKVFVTHADADHVNGISYLLEEGKIPIDTLFLPWQAGSDEKYDELKKLCVGRVEYLKAGDVIDAGRGKLYCLASEEGEATPDTNEQSLVLIYEEGEFSALLTGDAGIETEESMLGKYDLPYVTVLKCGHHGSQNSTCDELLDRTKPLTAVLSYGEGNRYGHPHRDVIEKLNRRLIPQLSTAERGAISFYTDGKKVKINLHCSQEGP